MASLVVATVIDIRTRRIPNELTASLAGVGVALAATGVSGVPLWASFAGFVVGLALMIPGHLLGATGAGDVKLMAAVGAVVGPATVVTAFLFTALPVESWRWWWRNAGGAWPPTIAQTGKLIASSDAGNPIRSAPQAHRFAYGPAIAVGSVLATLVK